MFSLHLSTSEKALPKQAVIDATRKHLHWLLFEFMSKWSQSHVCEPWSADSSDGSSEVLSTRTAAVVSEHSFRKRCTRHPSDGTGKPCHSLAHHRDLCGPPPTTTSKWPFSFPASGSSELAKPIDLKNYNFHDFFICVLFQKANSQLRSTRSAEWILPVMSDSPFVLGSPLPLLHLFREEREEHPEERLHVSST